MRLNLDRARNHLRDFDFVRLFIEDLGWDRHRQAISITVGDRHYQLSAVAEKRSFGVFLCPELPDSATRRRIDHEVTKTVREHLLIFTDRAGGKQIWQWVKREIGRPPKPREWTYQTSHTGQLLLQRLRYLGFTLDQEESLTLPDVAWAVGEAFDVEPVVRRFYDRFKGEHDAFAAFLDGIPDEGLQSWYVSVMLNRLMFIYFVQAKGFLDGDHEYLRHKLAESCDRGPDRYYREFLCPLFFEGFAKQPAERDPAVAARLGSVPYLNGGLFLRHQIEEQYGAAIQIPDAAFEGLFAFFGEWRWHLDERPLRHEKEINPDVLGYIYEKYINRKQMGAYYTKEDITGYISRSTIIPFLFDAAEHACAIAFRGEAPVWRLLDEDPDAYLWEAVRHGVDRPLPDYIAAGQQDVAQRGRWNEPAPEEYALPTEIWREVVARRARYEDVWLKLAGGEVRSINDLITYNLDLERFAADVIESCEGPDLLWAFWQAIERVTVLDPTCGSGAFLFAALNLLEPLYDRCLRRMAFFLAEWGEHGKSAHPTYAECFAAILQRVDRHPNHRYFVLKSIVINNLFGVDLMAEAVEICKLRLFLKLVAQVDDVAQIEPLPDIDFNIRAGNTLVGYATQADADRSFAERMDYDDSAARVRAAAKRLAGQMTWFRELQTDWAVEPATIAAAKADVQAKREALASELDQRLASEYGVALDDTGGGYSPQFDAWRKDHQPFHWFVEFYGIMEAGGFDVIIGNPPYVKWTPRSATYAVRGIPTAGCDNLYAMVMDRSLAVLRTTGRLGLIVLIGSLCTDGMRPLQDACCARTDLLHLSTYSGHTCPGVLFEGVANRFAVWLGRRGNASPVVFSSKYQKWYAAERQNLFSLLHYAPGLGFRQGACDKTGDPVSVGIMAKLQAERSRLGHALTGNEIVWLYTTPIHWVKALTFVPFFRSASKNMSGQLKSQSCDARYEDAVVGLLNSSLFFWWWIARSDCYHLVRREVDSFPVRVDRLMRSQGGDIQRHVEHLMGDLQRKSHMGVRNQKTTGRVEFQVLDPKRSKPIIDDIDRVLARHYGFTDEELDFIINYDIKYRMGRDGGGGEEEGVTP